MRLLLGLNLVLGVLGVFVRRGWSGFERDRRFDEGLC